MAKEPVERDRFRIIAEVDDLQLVGPVLAMLKKLGIDNIGYEVVTEVHTWQGNSRAEGGPRMEGNVEFAEEWLKTLPNEATFRPSDLGNHFTSVGRSKATAYTSLMKLIEMGLVEKISQGQYKRKLLQITKQTPEQNGAEQLDMLKASGEGSQKRYETTNTAAILAFAKSRKRVTTGQLRELFKKQNRNDGSVHPAVAKLVSIGKLKHTDAAGEYEVVKGEEANHHG